MTQKNSMNEETMKQKMNEMRYKLTKISHEEDRVDFEKDINDIEKECEQGFCPLLVTWLNLVDTAIDEFIHEFEFDTDASS